MRMQANGFKTRDEADRYANKIRSNSNARNVKVTKNKNGWSVSYTNLLMSSSKKFNYW